MKGEPTTGTRAVIVASFGRVAEKLGVDPILLTRLSRGAAYSVPRPSDESDSDPWYVPYLSWESPRLPDGRPLTHGFRVCRSVSTVSSHAVVANKEENAKRKDL